MRWRLLCTMTPCWTGWHDWELIPFDPIAAPAAAPSNCAQQWTHRARGAEPVMETSGDVCPTRLRWKSQEVLELDRETGSMRLRCLSCEHVWTEPGPGGGRITRRSAVNQA